MRLGQYLSEGSHVFSCSEQKQWNSRLREKVQSFQSVHEKPTLLYQEFERRVRTEELKAWYSCPEKNDLFQGTSVSSLVIPSCFKEPLFIESIAQLEEIIADQYILAHDNNIEAVRSAITEPVDNWVREGLFYGVVLPSKVIAQAFHLSIDVDSLIVNVDGNEVDPHEITSYPLEIREEYFEQTRLSIECLQGLDLSRREFEASLVLADVSKPNMQKYKYKALLGPVRCNEIAALMAQHVKKIILEKTDQRITPRSLEVVIYDTDTPFTYHHVMGHNGDINAPCLPGIALLGASGTIDAFRWLYAYRVSLIAQKMMKGSLYSQVKSSFMPFVFMGVLVPRDAQILLNLDQLDFLRYKGNISPMVEFGYLADSLIQYLRKDADYKRVDIIEGMDKINN